MHFCNRPTDQVVETLTSLVIVPQLCPSDTRRVEVVSSGLAYSILTDKIVYKCHVIHQVVMTCHQVVNRCHVIHQVVTRH